jgi:hypothetical protein
MNEKYDWNTNFALAPHSESVWACDENGKVYLHNAHSITEKKLIAWRLVKPPSPYVPPKPQQIEGLDFASAATLIKAVEKRTREIVAWEQKYEVKK